MENAVLPAPAGMEHSLLSAPDRALILTAATALSAALVALTDDLHVEGIRRFATTRLSVENHEP